MQGKIRLTRCKLHLTFVLSANQCALQFVKVDRLRSCLFFDLAHGPLVKVNRVPMQTRRCGRPAITFASRGLGAGEVSPCSSVTQSWYARPDSNTFAEPGIYRPNAASSARA